MAGYKVEICGVNTSKLPLLTNEEKTDLFRRIQNGDTDARETYIKGNLRLVLSVIQRFSSSSENVDDLFQIGCIGLIKAIDNFDLSQNVKFSTVCGSNDTRRGKTIPQGQQFHPGQPLAPGYRLQSVVSKRTSHKEKFTGTDDHGDRR